MMTKLLALVAAVSLAACVDDTSAPTDESAGSIDVQKDEQVVEPVGPTDLCAVLPTDEADPCSHLCDEEGGGINAFIPEHTCVLFVCHLTDGSTYHAGGCVP
ncbi:MAG TPA: hypothetical protein VFV99_03030 [Kofleriaceae bacterium]|nr:hypothetical protein [Kofleriaceae bacterium]